VRLATRVTLLEAAAGSSTSSASGPALNQAPPPDQVLNVEHDIEREARRWRVGVRTGVALDPELVLFGVQSQIGPIFTHDLSFRPNAEFAFGEVTDLIALNLEMAYRLPLTSRQGKWSAYAGAGPSLNFIHQSFNNGSGSRNISFGNFDYETGFNILTGLQFRRGTFVEVKTGLWSRPAPTFRMIFGYNF
jgi:hypothetical protein